MLYAEMRSGIPYSFENRMDYLTILYELFIEVYNSFENTEQEKTQGIQEDTSSDVRTVRDILYWYASDYCDVFLTDRIMEQIDPTYSPFAADIIESADLDNDRYVYSFGEFITANELGTARHLRTLPEETLRKMADVYTEGYRIGFINTGKDLSKKSVVNIRYSLGFEKVIRIAIENFRKMGLEPVIYRAASGIITKREHHKIGYYGAVANWQYEYDHRYDSALFMDKAFRDRKLAVLKTAYEQYKTEAGLYAGPAVIETFGEAGFQPVNKPEAWAFTEKQQKLYLEYRNLSMPVVDEYVPGDETSFTLIAFPVPAIGADFEEIFKETIRINTLDYDLYRDMQQKLIDALDQAEYAEIKGRGTNCTDLRVRLHPLKDPKTQTKFENCVADVNIPVGEVFTSPVLEGTEGVLNVGTVYIGEIQYKNLKLRFENGRVAEASCDNFPEDPEAGRRLVIQGIMGGHESLPLGEFAIGTNTTAYEIAERYGILDRLPILIVEKMGPHFAVGDTCYSWSEDTPMYNPDGKEMIARDNEISLLRKEDPSKAYFGVHNDITIPYNEMAKVTAVHADGTRVDLISDGRFVLPGVEELNRPLERCGL